MPLELGKSRMLKILRYAAQLVPVLMHLASVTPQATANAFADACCVLSTVRTF